MYCCDRCTCDAFTGTEVIDGSYPCIEEFVKNIHHGKCKVIQLARNQMQRLMQEKKDVTDFTVSTVPTTDLGSPIRFYRNIEGGPSREVDDKLNRNDNVENADEQFYSRISPHNWIRRAVYRLRQRIKLILAAVGIGVLVWTFLLYGIFLHASLCRNVKYSVF